MSTIYPGRFTARTDQPFVVFLIGMRINKLWAVHRWLPVAQAMGPMLAELYKHPEKGFLGGTFAFTLSGPLIVQYWRSFEDLERFARDPNDPHLPAWKRFYKFSKQGDAVGIWHETYQVNPGQFESVYVTMPKFGLGSVMEHVPASGRFNAARDRLGQP
ncbi:MAG: DUF4188 domain-containing protein [Chloroflexi bacterium]|nr:MAG: DUF4188 domain-containing protein [Chloroflexota bacterium]